MSARKTKRRPKATTGKAESAADRPAALHRQGDPIARIEFASIAIESATTALETVEDDLSNDQPNLEKESIYAILVLVREKLRAEVAELESAVGEMREARSALQEAQS